MIWLLWRWALGRVLMGRNRQRVYRSWMGGIGRIRGGMSDLIRGLISSNFAHGRKTRRGLEILRRRKELGKRPGHRSVLARALSSNNLRCAHHINEVVVITQKTKLFIINNVVKHHIFKISFGFRSFTKERRACNIEQYNT